MIYLFQKMASEREGGSSGSSESTSEEGKKEDKQQKSQIFFYPQELTSLDKFKLVWKILQTST